MKRVLMLPVASLLSSFPKMVRDLARSRGKQAELTITGADSCHQTICRTITVTAGNQCQAQFSYHPELQTVPPGIPYQFIDLFHKIKGIEFKRAHLYDINPVGVDAIKIPVH